LKPILPVVDPFVFTTVAVAKFSPFSHSSDIFWTNSEEDKVEINYDNLTI